MNVLALCAGVGGLELGIRIAVPGARGIAYVEREAFAAANLVSRMETGALHHAPVWSDLATFDARPWRGVVHCVASGDPCQPNSVAGRGLGDADERFLIDQVVRIVSECRPDRLFRENVTGNADGQLAALVPALERMGYRVAAGIFSAAEVGASHRRDRLFIMADRIGGGLHRDDGRGAGQQPSDRSFAVADTDGRNASAEREQRGGQQRLQPRRYGDSGNVGDAAHDNGRRGDSRPQEGTRQDGIGRRGFTVAGPDLADASDAGSQGDRFAGTRHDERDGSDAHGSASEFRGICLPAFAPGPADGRWPAIIAASPQLEPAVRRMANGMADRVDRLRACGNGVVPLAAAYAWRTLDALHRQQRAGAGEALVA